MSVNELNTPTSPFWPGNWAPYTIKIAGGISGGVVSNLTGIPFDRFRVLVAQDLGSAKSMLHHTRRTFQSLPAAFIGGNARICMKSMAAMLNLFVPPCLREKYPFVMSFAVGCGFSPLLNVPRMFQLGRISGNSYGHTFNQLFTSLRGLRTYMGNTIVFGPGEGLRMMMCFGAKDWLWPRLGGNVALETVKQPTLYTGKMALIAGPAVAAVETTAALITETATTIHAHMNAGGEHKKSFLRTLKDTATPRYIVRCWTSLFLKNTMANTPLFWMMFMGDMYRRFAGDTVEKM